MRNASDSSISSSSGDSACCDEDEVVESSVAVLQGGHQKPSVDRYLEGHRQMQQQQLRHREDPILCRPHDHSAMKDNEEVERKNSNDSGYHGSAAPQQQQQQQKLKVLQQHQQHCSKSDSDLAQQLHDTSPIRTGRMMTPVVRAKTIMLNIAKK